ncbi:methionine ABC transporter ATP-binding protein [Changpingibacter yushuensis]|uniref:methionine ABC transporter ATP-binding protein n=1 Tax=Changpingibacter yushuensis TaxID=2758440 RepID=UPI0015F4020D|nr:methionine ABC transporter ATP-binding protein [Changpingibacter yushuensis]
MIELKDVRKVYPRRGEEDVVALDGISLTVPSGEIHGIVGESGAGKSTLIRCLTALEKPSSGSILVDGNNLSELPANELRDARRTIGMVFQGANLLDARTAAGNIAYPLRLAGLSKGETRDRVGEMLRLVGIADRSSSFPSQLSGGQRQRVGIARAMADSPSVLLCDEPTSALDTETTDQILGLLKSVRDTYGVTVLIITHEMGVVRKICDSVTLLDHGRIVSSGPVSEVVSDVSSPLARQIVPNPSLDRDDVVGKTIIDVAFTSRPGEPTGSRVMAMAAELGADIGAGTFETLGNVQVARLALTLDPDRADEAIDSFSKAGIVAEVRSA